MRALQNRNRMFLVIGLLVIGGMFVAISAQHSTRLPRTATTFPPSSIVHGGTYGEWSARHWQWTVSFPLNANPGHDVTGETCGDGQYGPVFFLPRNFAPCTIPAGPAILVPIAGTECSSIETTPFSGTSERELRDCAAREIERYTNIRLSVNGEDVPDIESYRASSPLFTLSLPEHNILGAPAGVAYAVADGYQVILRPLPPGEHEIVVHLELTDGTVLPDKLIHLNVVEPVWSAPEATPAVLIPVATPGATPITE